MSARNTSAEKRRRREARGVRHERAGLMHNLWQVAGICRTCSRRNVLWLPERVCEPCLTKVGRGLGELLWYVW